MSRPDAYISEHAHYCEDPVITVTLLLTHGSNDLSVLLGWNVGYNFPKIVLNEKRLQRSRV